MLRERWRASTRDLADVIGKELGVEMEVVDTAFETLFARFGSEEVRHGYCRYYH